MPRPTPVPTRALVLSDANAGPAGALRVARALAAGLREGGAPDPDICTLDGRTEVPIREALDEVGFDTRMRAARALLLAVDALEESTLAGSLAFEAATRARQAGVPCYAVTARTGLGAFDVRILDLQVVIEADGPAGLREAGRRLAELI